jgi:homoaconitase/3-isopropylmalate dehydratase large subunit
VAIKTVIFSSAGGDKETALVASEAAIASNLSHRNIVATYSHDILDVQKSVGPELGIYKFYLIQVCADAKACAHGAHADRDLPLESFWKKESCS